jgi:hypothetical protein
MLNALTHRNILKQGIPAQATVVSMGAHDRGNASFNLRMTLRIYVKGMTPYEVSDQWLVKSKDLVALSGSIPIKVDPYELAKVAIDWDGVRAKGARVIETAQPALAAQDPWSGGVPDLSP